MMTYITLEQAEFFSLFSYIEHIGNIKNKRYINLNVDFQELENLNFKNIT